MEESCVLAGTATAERTPALSVTDDVHRSSRLIAGLTVVMYDGSSWRQRGVVQRVFDERYRSAPVR